MGVTSAIEPTGPRPSAARAPGPWNTPFSALSIAAYGTWLAIAWEPAARALLPAPGVDRGLLAVGVACLLVQLVAFITVIGLGDAPAGLPVRRLLVLAQAAAVLVAVRALLPSGSTAVLLIVVAAQLAPLFDARGRVAALVAINVILAVVLSRSFSFRAALPDLLAYAGFQAFAALTTTTARSAALARDDLARINGELLATRRLLLESARNEERLRLSRDLHDAAGHSLTALKLQLRAIAATLPDAQRGAIDECRLLADRLLDDVRGIVGVLRVDAAIDLEAALADLVAAVAGPNVTVHVDKTLQISRLGTAECLLRCAQAALTNALRHSHAAHISISVACIDDQAVLQIDDDGIASRLPLHGHGLRGMAERLAERGGRLDVALRPGGGLRVTATVPQQGSEG